MLTASLAAFALTAAEPPPLRQGLEPLAFLVGHCWRGTLARGERDTHCFESVYGGQHVRDRHEVTGGARTYRGETLYSWDGTANAVTYTYWNSQGGVSRGTMRPRDGLLDFGDESYTDPQGRRVTISTRWRLAPTVYQAFTTSATLPSMNRIVTYERVEAVTVSSGQGPDGRHNLVHEVILPAAPAEVWRAISTAEGWRTWAVPVAWTPRPDTIETSYTPTARSGDPTTILQGIFVAVPERMLVFRTVRPPVGFPNFETYAQVTSILEIEAAGDGRTRVRLTGAGYADNEAGRQLMDFFREGNRVSLERLRRRFVDGPIDWTAELARER
ncbi:MAG TPA: SRPBCC domain-containing protein [Allosphingosinicella sp.]|jgi:uncharacterized protein YndB with AHSA1/START domain